MEEDSSINNCDLCATKDMQIIDLLKNTVMLQKTIVEIGEKTRRTIESKYRVIEGVSKEVDIILDEHKKEYGNFFKILEYLTKEYEEIIHTL